MQQLNNKVLLCRTWSYGPGPKVSENLWLSANSTVARHGSITDQGYPRSEHKPSEGKHGGIHEQNAHPHMWKSFPTDSDTETYTLNDKPDKDV